MSTTQLYLALSLFCGCLRVSTASLSLIYDLPEESPSGILVDTLSTNPSVRGLYSHTGLSNLRFNFLSRNTTGFQSFFALTEKDGRLETTREPADREEVCPAADTEPECVISLDVAIQQGNELKVIHVNVRLVDINDHAPKFLQPSVQLVISEMAAPGTGFSLPGAEDPDSGAFGIQRYQLQSDEDPAEKTEAFRLTSEQTVDGTTELRLVLVRSLDREQVDRHRVKVVAFDGGSPAKTGSLLVDVVVQDANDNRPRFLKPAYDVSIEENIANGTIICVVRAVDGDAGVNGVVTFALARNTQRQFGHLFAVGAGSGELKVIGSIDYERRDRYALGVVAGDGGSNPSYAHVIVSVYVTDVNDNAPIVSVSPLSSSGKPEVVENAAAGAFVAHVSVSDPDTGPGGEWDCSLGGDPGFRLESIPDSATPPRNEFKLVTSTPFDREAADTRDVILSCADRGLPVLTSTSLMTIVIVDENDETPMFDRPEYVASVRENNRVGDYVTEVRAVDRDLHGNGEISYSVAPAANDNESVSLLPVRIDRKSGRIYAGVVFDRETRSRYDFRLVAVDAGSPARSAAASFRLEIGDVNDEPPRFSSSIFTFGTYENQPAGTEIGTVTATDRDEYPNDRIVYDTEYSDTFRMNASTGKITALKSLDRESVPVYLLNVTARNPGTSLIGTTQVKVIVADRNDNAPRIRFPSAANRSVQVSSRARIGDVIASVDAYDVDVGSNAALRHVITGSDADGGGGDAPPFGVNLISGAISVLRDLSPLADRMISVTLLVHDEGTPRNSASATLLVTVNSTIPPAAAVTSLPASGTPAISMSNFTVVLIASGISMLVIVALIVSLIVLRRCSSNDRRPEVPPAGRPEVDKMLPLMTSHGIVTNLHSDGYPDKSNLLRVVNDPYVTSDERTVDKKNRKNAHENRKNANRNRKYKNCPEAETDKQIAWLTSYEDNNLLQVIAFIMHLKYRNLDIEP